jgi:DNA-binding NarL/FixJ family response regulator
MRETTVLVAHRAQMLGEGLAAALARFTGLVTVGVATNAAEIRHPRYHVDAVALDAGIDDAQMLASELRRRGTRVVFIGSAPAPDESAWVPTEASIDRLAAALAPAALATAPHASTKRALTRRERQILELVAGGLAAKQVARTLGISPKTVEQHKTRIFAKLGVRNQTAAVSVLLGARGPHAAFAATSSA